MPLVSVCIPVYNGEKHIREAIESVLKQSYKDLELLIIDNNSTDKTQDIVKGISDKRIRYIRNETNIGMVGNWNLCLDEAKGEYIHFLCADDLIDVNCIEKKINIFNQYKNVNLVFNATYIINDQNKVIMKRRPFHSDKLLDGKKFALKSFRNRNYFGEPSNVMFKKDVSKKMGYFDKHMCYATDWDYWLRLSILGEVYYIDEYLMYYRVSNSSETSNLLKTKKKLEADDTQLINNYQNNNKLKRTDIIIHKFNVKSRMYARELFHKINNLRLGV